MAVSLRFIELVARNVAWLALGILFPVAIALALATLRWEYEHDTPLLQYAGLLIEKFGFVPYRDFFETSMPGVFAFHAAIIHLFGAGNLAFALVNLAFLALVLFTAWLFLSRIDAVAAIAFVPLYTIVYLMGGPSIMLQRDGLALLPISAALAIVAMERPGSHMLRQLLCGMLFGVAATIKPQLALGGPFVVAAGIVLHNINNHSDGFRVRRYLAPLTCAAVGFAIPISVALIWLASHDALQPFLFMVTQYLPLHIQQTGHHVWLPPDERLFYLVRRVVWANSYVYFAPFVLLAAVGVWPILRRDRKKGTLIILTFALLIVYALSPGLSGQFWPYHYMPFVFFLIMTLSFLLYAGRAWAASGEENIAVAGATKVAFIAVAIWGTSGVSSKTFQPSMAKGGRVERMAQALRANMAPNDTVQPIDWTDGTIHAMLRLNLPLPTPFLYDYHFHHNVDTPTIQTIRRQFIDAFMRASPTLLVEAPRRPKVSGIGTEAAFPEFDRIVATNYRVVYQDPSLRIWRRMTAKNASR